jgi:hypothetical protein
MRTVTEIPKPPEVGDKRIVSMWTLVPITITSNGIMEKRWLERVHVEQELNREWIKDRWEYYWKDLRFVD